MSDSRRGFVPADEKEFNFEGQNKLRRAQKDLLYLLEQGYPIKNASTFVGNHFMLSERQRLALARATVTSHNLEIRKNKQLNNDSIGKSVVIDGLNVVITLEVALSQGTLIRCMDSVIRDLAGLRGTYRLIDQTDEAIKLIGDKFAQLSIEEVIFYLDAPVSNTGRLKRRILELLNGYPFRIDAELVNNADAVLKEMEYVITGDAIILNQCISWYNLTSAILDNIFPELMVIDLSLLKMDLIKKK